MYAGDLEGEAPPVEEQPEKRDDQVDRQDQHKRAFAQSVHRQPQMGDHFNLTYSAAIASRPPYWSNANGKEESRSESEHPPKRVPHDQNHDDANDRQVDGIHPTRQLTAVPTLVNYCQAPGLPRWSIRSGNLSKSPVQTRTRDANQVATRHCVRAIM